MGRRKRRDDDWVWAVAQLAGLAVAASLLVPQVRAAMSTIAVVLACLAGLTLAGLIALAFYRRSKRSSEVNLASQPTPSEGGYTPPDPSVTHSASLFQPQPTVPKPIDLLELVRQIDWFQFEKLVAWMYRKQGYAVHRRGGANPDGGIDLVIEKEGQRLAVQCKQWKTWNVGVKAVREFLGALTDAKIQKGVFVTLSGYSEEAKQLAEKHGIQIVREADLMRMLESASAKSDPEALAILRDKRKFCPKCEQEMILRTATKGEGAGKQFWGCSAYPRCRFTLPKD
jgi:hypothetical protein